MAYDLIGIYGYGTGAKGDVSDPAGQICSYARVASVTEVSGAKNAVTIEAPSVGAYGGFEEGEEILLHVSGCIGGTDPACIGRWGIFKVIGTQASVLSSAGKILLLDRNMDTVLPVEVFAQHIVQVVTIPHFSTLTVSGTIAPPAFDSTKKYGGILAFKCKTELKMSGNARIDLVDKGIPVAQKAWRYWTKQEHSTHNIDATATTSGNGLLDTDLYAGWENASPICMPLNAGDGTCFAWVKKLTNVESSANTRIGGTTAGAKYTRGNIGGSCIHVVAGTFVGFVPTMISTRRTKTDGRGIGRCHIVSGTTLPDDGGLYGYDVGSNPQRVMKTLNIRDFGSGRHGTVTNPTKPLNNYARVTKIDGGGKAVTYTNLTVDGLADFSDGALVMVHISKHTDAADMSLSGRFIFARVVHHYTADRILLLDTDISALISTEKLPKYDVQIIAVFEPSALTLSSQYTATAAWDDTKKTGGICVVACAGLCDLKNGGIIVTEKGGGKGEETSDFYTSLGNVQMNTRLPLGSRGGSILLISRTMDTNTSSRMGNAYDGSAFGGAGGAGGSGAGAGGSAAGPGAAGGPAVGYLAGLNGVGGKRPNSGTDTPASAGGAGAGGGGGAGGQKNSCGGAGGTGAKRPFNTCTNVHIFLVVDTIKRLSMHCISTGGAGGAQGAGGGVGPYAGDSGGPGGKGGAGYPGGGGGGGGAGIYELTGGDGQPGQLPGGCFIYVNHVENFDTMGVEI